MPQTTIKILLIILFSTTFTCNAYGALAPRMYSIIFQLAGSIKDHSNPPATSQTYSNKMDFNLLYFVRGGPTFGFRYLIESRNENANESGEAYGPSAGYYWERGFYVLAHYDILSKLGHWTNGEGTQFDIGYLEHLGGQFHIGFQISDKRTVYRTDKASNLSEDRTVKDSYPSLVLMYLF